MCTACAAPSAAPIEPQTLARTVGERGVDPAHLEQALEAARIEPLAVPVPTAAFDPSSDADDAALWHASAFVYEARTRAARHALLAARAAARSAGAPMPVRAMLEVEELDRPDDRARMTLTFDLLGIFGLGPAGAARELADAEVRRALGELELAVWDARVEVDRARARLATVRAQRAAVEGLVDEARSARTRAEILDRTGRLAAQAVAEARSSEERVELRLRRLEADEAAARAALAVAAGLAQESPWLDAVSPATLEAWRFDAAHTLPARALLLGQSPELRVATLEHATAEARLRGAVAQRWPTFELGPHLLWNGDELLTGLITGTAIPWPGSIDGAVSEALERREAALSALEDELVAVEARAHAAEARVTAARRGYLDHATALDTESAGAWRAAGARFAVEPMALMDWAYALSMRAEALVEVHAARFAAIEAELDLERALGPAPIVDGFARVEGAR